MEFFGTLDIGDIGGAGAFIILILREVASLLRIVKDGKYKDLIVDSHSRVTYVSKAMSTHTAKLDDIMKDVENIDRNVDEVKKWLSPDDSGRQVWKVDWGEIMEVTSKKLLEASIELSKVSAKLEQLTRELYGEVKERNGKGEHSEKDGG